MAVDKEPTTKKPPTRRKLKDPSRILWNWVGVGQQLGGWVPIGGKCEQQGCTHFYPPRPGKRPFELVWTVCKPVKPAKKKKMSDKDKMGTACEDGWCEFDSSGNCVSNNCPPECTCISKHLEASSSGIFFPDPNTITACPMPIP